MELRPYQKECIEKIKNNINKGVRLLVIVMATGTGKTVVFSQFPEIVKKSGKKTLVLAHREELLTQAKKKINIISPDVKVEIEQWPSYASDSADVVVASVATLWRKDSDRIKRFNPEEFWLIVIDEAHHAVSSTYKNVLSYFGANKEEGVKWKHPVVLWVTATPNRRDNVGMNTVFDELVYKYDIKNGIEDWFLTPIKAYTIKTGSTLDGIKRRMWDFAINELSKVVNQDERNQLILKSYTRICPNEKAITFCVDVAHAKELSRLFSEAGYKSAYVSGETSKEDRKRILKDFESGDLEVLFNCQLLTEGYDNPEVRAVLFARPTSSSSLYIQMAGRGTRLAEWKDHVKFLDFVDNMSKNSIVSSSHLIGLDQPINANGHYIMELQDQFEELLSSHPDEDVMSVDIDNIEARIQEVDIFRLAQLPEIIKNNSAFSRIPTPFWFKLSLGRDSSKEDVNLSVEIRQNILWKYNISFFEETEDTPSFKNWFKKVKKSVREELDAKTELEAIERADKHIHQNYRSNVNLVSQDASWRSQPPTEKQVKLLKKFGYKNADKLSKGQASNLLSKYFAQSKKSKRTWKSKK